jgi:16S rRNA (cytosine967-C5)-methyltransferase
LAAVDPVTASFPEWMFGRWVKAYGDTDARRIALASLQQAPLDISVKVRSEAAEWVGRLGGVALPTGTVRLAASGRVEDLAGFAEGAWWVQDAAAALPARLLGDVSGQTVADLCAAPGGKTAELAAAGASVTAVEISDQRARRIAENLARLNLKADIVISDILAWKPAQTYDAVLLDAPCTATGTIRRHPDILHLKRVADIEGLAVLQAAMIDHAVKLVRPGGLIVYCTCSLEPEEGVEQMEAALRRHPELERVPVRADELHGADEILTPTGDLRTLPFHRLGGDPIGAGMDGFFAARLRKRA